VSGATRTLDLSLTDDSQFVRTYPRGRICAHPGCDTILSIYNAGQTCAQHPIKARWKKCPKCEGAYPRTLEYWPPRKGATEGLSYMCRECRFVYDHERQPPRKARANRPSLHVVSSEKVCSRCHTMLAIVAFRIKHTNTASGTRSRPIAVCRECEKAQNAARYHRRKSSLGKMVKS
jgi:rubredoxin